MGTYEGLNVALLMKKCYTQFIETKDSSFRSIQIEYFYCRQSFLAGSQASSWHPHSLSADYSFQFLKCLSVR